MRDGRRGQCRPGKRRHGFSRCGRHGHALGCIGQPGADPHRESAGVVDLLGPVRGVERRIDLGEVPHVRAVQNGGAELDRLNRVLTAMTGQ